MPSWNYTYVIYLENPPIIDHMKSLIMFTEEVSKEGISFRQGILPSTFSTDPFIR